MDIDNTMDMNIDINVDMYIAIEMEIGCAWHVSNVVFIIPGINSITFLLLSFCMSFWSLFGALGVIEGSFGSLRRLGVPLGCSSRTRVGVPWGTLGSPGAPRGCLGCLLGDP